MEEDEMHPSFWFIMFCAAFVVIIATVINKKKK